MLEARAAVWCPYPLRAQGILFLLKSHGETEKKECSSNFNSDFLVMCVQKQDVRKSYCFNDNTFESLKMKVQYTVLSDSMSCSFRENKKYFHSCK